MKFEGKLIYNLAFGDVREDGKIDDFAESNNGDIVRIIATVIASIYEYTSRFHHAIYFRGSNKQRTRFYQTILRRKKSLLVDDFEILGIIESNQTEMIETFDPEFDYDAFLIVRKLK